MKKKKLWFMIIIRKQRMHGMDIISLYWKYDILKIRNYEYELFD